MADVQESYPTPTTGLSKALKIKLTGTGVTQIAGQVYKVSLSLAGTSTVSVTAEGDDMAGTNQTVTAGHFNWVSRNAAPSAANAGDVQESFPLPKTTLGQIATVAAATGNPIVVTAQRAGLAEVEVSLEFADANQGAASLKSSKVYAMLLVTVGP